MSDFYPAGRSSDSLSEQKRALQKKDDRSMTPDTKQETQVATTNQVKYGALFHFHYKYQAVAQSRPTASAAFL